MPLLSLQPTLVRKIDGKERVERDKDEPVQQRASTSRQRIEPRRANLLQSDESLAFGKCNCAQDVFKFTKLGHAFLR